MRAALAEDLGLAGDITTNALIPADAVSEATIALREDGRIAGLPLAIAAFRALDPGMAIEAQVREGAQALAGTAIARLSGKTRAILSAERVALNLVQRLSGVATATHHFVEAVAGTGAKIVCTRKTTPGLRAFEKYAVRAGGGSNHRFGLFDAVLIKDNHIAAAGSVGAAIERARAAVGHMVKIEVEVDTLAQLEEALHHTIDAVLLDNMAVPELKNAVARGESRAARHPVRGFGRRAAGDGARHRGDRRGHDLRGRAHPFGEGARYRPGFRAPAAPVSGC